MPFGAGLLRLDFLLRVESARETGGKGGLIHLTLWSCKVSMIDSAILAIFPSAIFVVASYDLLLNGPNHSKSHHKVKSCTRCLGGLCKIAKGEKV